jgi:cbb3-type cytochrome oxidase subunit 3
MNTINKTTEKADGKIPVQMKLSALWAALMFLYVYADIFSLYRPGQIEEVMAGRMGPFPVTQGSLLTAAILMLIPALMVFLALGLKPGVARWANIILGLLYTVVNIGNLVAETWAFYVLFGLVEMALTLLIVGYAWKWRNAEA